MKNFFTIILFCMVSYSVFSQEYRNTIENHKANKLFSCGLSTDFEEPKLDLRIQSKLKRNKASVIHLKQKVAKDYGVTTKEITLLDVDENIQKGQYQFCVTGQEVNYRRVGALFFKRKL